MARRRNAEGEQESSRLRKKGPWTPEEDSVLKDYVSMHGERNWNMVDKRCGLMRCGKSARLRWFNHLRPDLKKGPFSPEEERIVIQLHAQIGNRWACIATKLSGRSDNEIKNYWNTRIKKLERAGLPMHAERFTGQHIPMQHSNPSHTTPFSFSYQTHLSNLNKIPNPQTKEIKLSNQLSMGPFNYYPNLNLPKSSFPNNLYPMIGNDNNLTIGSSSNYSLYSSIPSSSTMPIPNPPDSFEFHSLFSSGGFSSNQSELGPLPDVYKYSNVGNEFINMPELYDPQYYSNGGLLEDVIGAPTTLVQNGMSSDKGKEICTSADDYGSCSIDTSIGIENWDAIEKMLPFYEDLSALLDSIPKGKGGS